MASNKIDRIHFFAAGFVILFLMDMLLTSGMAAVGMAPLAFLMAAVCLFDFLSFSTKRSYLTTSISRFLILWWKIYLLALSFSWLFFNFFAFLSNDLAFFNKYFIKRLFDDHQMLITYYIEWFSFAYSVVTVILTMIIKLHTRSYRWMIFTAWAFVFRSLVPIVLDPMPVIIYRYEGLCAVPVLYGLLMIALTSIQEQYRLVTDGLPMSGGHQ
jgi:hypothetical protein